MGLGLDVVVHIGVGLAAARFGIGAEGVLESLEQVRGFAEWL